MSDPHELRWDDPDGDGIVRAYGARALFVIAPGEAEGYDVSFWPGADLKIQWEQGLPTRAAARDSLVSCFEAVRTQGWEALGTAEPAKRRSEPHPVEPEPDDSSRTDGEVEPPLGASIDLTSSGGPCSVCGRPGWTQQLPGVPASALLCEDHAPGFVLTPAKLGCALLAVAVVVWLLLRFLL